MTEKRNVTIQNGVPVGHSTLLNLFKLQRLPLVVHDGFARSFSDYLGADAESCNTYKLVPQGMDDGDLLVLQVTGSTPVKPGSHCTSLSPGIVATLWIDRRTYQVQREKEQDPTLVHHGEKSTIDATIDYRMVPLGPKNYLLASNVHVVVQSVNGRDKFAWDSSYSNCHIYTSNSTKEPLKNAPLLMPLA